MKHSLMLLLCLVPVITLTQESNIIHKHYIEGGITAGSNSKGAAAGVMGGFGTYFRVFGKQSAFDIHIKSLFTEVPEREVGSITFTFRLYFGKGFYTGLGGVHNHEVNWTVYKKDPIGVSLGIHKELIHRTGFAAEAGYDFMPWLKKDRFGIYPSSNFCVSYFIYDNEPNPLFTIGVGLKFGWKKTE